jgi:hypothetical protein
MIRVVRGVSRGQRKQPAPRTERSADGESEAVEICRVGSGMYVVRTYLCPKGEGSWLQIPTVNGSWVLMIDTAVIQAGGRRVVTLSTARYGLSFKRSMGTRGRRSG